jgi:hypothetical protein
MVAFKASRLVWLATVFRASVPKTQLAASLRLEPQLFITGAQSVGYLRS